MSGMMNWSAGLFRLSAALTLLGLAVTGCGGSSSPSAPPPSPPPSVVLTTLAPNTAVAGNADLIVTATGSGYTTASVLKWNGTALTTNYVSTTSLTGTIPSADLTSPGTFSVT